MKTERVVRVIEAAREVSRQPGNLLANLIASTGLSAEGVRLALTDHLELTPTAGDLHRLIETTPRAESVHVVLSANVFVGALRAIAIACAAAPDVTVRPSSRDPHFAAALVHAIDHPSVRLAESLVPTRGEIHIYGRDETIADVRRAAKTGVIVRGHGAGMGVAVVSDKADLEESARALTKDIVPFDQRGCLSPRVAFVFGLHRAQAFMEHLHGSLALIEHLVPRGRLSKDEMADAERYESTVAYAGELVRGATHAVGCSTAVLIPPAGRHVHVVALEGGDNEADALFSALAPISRWVVTVGSDDGSWSLPHARSARLGEMQKPPLDGPVDRRNS